MQLQLIWLLYILNLVQNIKCKQYRTIPLDEVLEYDLDKTVTPYSDLFSINNLILEQIDDDTIEIGGYAECLTSFDRNTPMSVLVNTRAQEQSVWKDQAIKLSMPDACREFLNPDRFWYNMTRLWNADVCPPQKGTKLHIEKQSLSAILNLPDALSSMPWRAYILVTQTVPLGKPIKFGFALQSEFVPA